MNRSEVSGMTVVSVAASEEVSESESPDLPSGFFHLNSAGIYLEALPGSSLLSIFTSRKLGFREVYLKESPL
jgi:hypothetical protein